MQTIIDYRSQTSTVIPLTPALDLHFLDINRNIAHMVCTDKSGKKCCFPDGFSLVDAIEKEIVSPYKDHYLLTWFQDYHIKLNGVVIYKIINTRQQNIYSVR